MNTKNKIICFICFFFIFGLYISETLEKQRLDKQLNELSEHYKKILDQHINGFEINFANDVKEIVEERNVLFYRYSQYMCETCVYEDLTLLKQLQDSIGYNNIIILPSFNEDKNSIIRLLNELKGFRYKNIPIKKANFPIDRRTYTEVRYMGYINDIGNIEMCFIPIKGECKLTWKYLSNIKNLFFRF